MIWSRCSYDNKFSELRFFKMRSERGGGGGGGGGLMGNSIKFFYYKLILKRCLFSSKALLKPTREKQKLKSSCLWVFFFYMRMNTCSICCPLSPSLKGHSFMQAFNVIPWDKIGKSFLCCVCSYLEGSILLKQVQQPQLDNRRGFASGKLVNVKRRILFFFYPYCYASCHCI